MTWSTNDAPMSEAEANDARQRFAFPPFNCVGIVDLTATRGGWFLKIANVRGAVSEFGSEAEWLMFWQRFLYRQQMARDFEQAQAADPSIDAELFQQQYELEHPIPRYTLHQS